MTSVGQIEFHTQKRIIELLKSLGWEYLGDWHTREGNSNIESEYLQRFLVEQSGVNPELAAKAIADFQKEAANQVRSLYDTNKEVYTMLRYGVKVSPEPGQNMVTVPLVNWAKPELNHFAVAEEVTVNGQHTKRPDLVLYVNGIALGVIELKRSTVSVAEGIRQNLDNQKPLFIQQFFATIQLVMAANDTEGMRYGVIQTPEKYMLTWKEPSDIENALDRQVTQVCKPARFLELIYDFIVFDAGTKKTARHNQFFGVKAAQEFLERREGGIIWHTQGSGKSLTMVWLARWIRENLTNARVLLITDRTELDEQIEKVFVGVGEQIRRTSSGADLIDVLNAPSPSLICSLVHKFGGTDEDATDEFLAELRRKVASGFEAKGDIYVFVDECHRTQTGKLHNAMKAILPNATFIGFTGTPLLKEDKETSLETFGRYIHTYKFDEAVRDGVVLDLRYEARDIDQTVTAQDKIDQWFDVKTKGLNDVAKARLKQRWGTMRNVLSSKGRLEQIVKDILMDFETKDRLMSGHGNAMLVSDRVYNACRLYELFDGTPLEGKIAIVTSYRAGTSDVTGEETGEGETENQLKYDTYQKMLAGRDVEAFETEVKEKFIKEPGQMKLLIVVDKLLTGFDAPPATYLYIDKQMRDHGLFQAICRVNRLDGDDKEYGYIVDYKDLFRSIEGAFNDYTQEAFANYDKADIAGLLSNRLEKGKERLDDALEAIRALCEHVEQPRDSLSFQKYFCPSEEATEEERAMYEQRRVALYHLTAALLRSYANMAADMELAGYPTAEGEAVRVEVGFWTKLRDEICLASGDFIDLKQYEPAMRHLIDSYIRAEDSEVVSNLNDLSLVTLLVDRVKAMGEKMPKRTLREQEAVAEAIENNIRKTIIDSSPSNPQYFERMSRLLESLVTERKAGALDYAEYLKKLVEMSERVQDPSQGGAYPGTINSGALRALFDNLGQDEELAVKVDAAIRQTKKADWRGNLVKEREIRAAIRPYVFDSGKLDELMNILKAQSEY